ncbi:MAG TPA: phospholipase D-like domain-containing protein [Myxococcales bacterium]|nr:phospholipase D-like domain-containing protein [Myxococcales bacterium]
MTVTALDRIPLQPARMLPGHRLHWLFGGGRAYPAMLDAIAGAKTEICLETYIWASDANGRRFVDAVCIKAQEGVRVRCVIDGAGSFGFSSDDIARMKDAGVLLSVFHPVGPWRRRWGWQVRDHRKLLLVDGRVGFCGGMNLGDDYAPVDWGGRGWNDVHAQVEGPVLRDLYVLFEITWRYAVPWNFEVTHALAARASLPEPPAIHGATTRVQAVAVGRFIGRKAVQHHLQHAFAAARERIWIQAAYFVPNRALRGALKRAARRGVDVRIIVPRHSDVPFLNDASRYTWSSLLKAGVRIFEWLPGMLHSKTVSVDGLWCAVGSYNLDARSLIYNWEVTLAVLDDRLTADLDDRFADDTDKCEQVVYARWRRRGLLQRLRERFFYFFRLWL